MIFLGSIVFTDLEIPERVPFGGDQALAVHKLIGGVRVVDAMGPDDMDLSWSGRFQGPLATLRARQLDALRASGAEVPLTFGAFTYLVVVKHAALNFERFYQIPYSVTCLPVASPSFGGVLALAASLDSLVFGDMASVVTLTAAFAAAA